MTSLQFIGYLCELVRVRPVFTRSPGQRLKQRITQNDITHFTVKHSLKALASEPIALHLALRVDGLALALWQSLHDC